MAYGILFDYLMGQSIDAFHYFGAHFGYIEVDKEEVVPAKTPGGRAKKVKVKEKVYGVWFRLYAPMASDVSVIGEFNGWDVRVNKMNKVDSSGVYETFIAGLHDYQSYKYHFKNARGEYVDKADPFAFYSEYRPQSCSRLFNIEGFPGWMAIGSPSAPATSIDPCPSTRSISAAGRARSATVIPLMRKSRTT